MASRQILALSIVLALAPIAGALPVSSGEAPRKQKVSQVSDIQQIDLHSRILDEDRTLLVRLPRGYDSAETRYPVLFVLDAEWHFNIAAANVELLSECSYISPHPVPQLIVVGIVNRDRNRDFTPTRVAETLGMRFPTSGGAHDFRRFLIEEVLPAIDATYRTHPFRILAGWSLGGLFTVDTVLGDTPLFDAYLAISPSLWWDDELIMQKLPDDAARTAPAQTKKLIVTLGTAEQQTMVERSTHAFVDYVGAHPQSHLVTELVPIEGLGHNYSPQSAYFLGLATVFADWNLPPETFDRGLAAIDAYYASLTAHYHFEIPTPEDVYGKLGWNLFEADQRDEAAEVFQTWVGRHPHSSVALASLGSFYRETGEKGKAIAMLRSALEAEEQSTDPRSSFILDLRRDLDGLSLEN